MAVTDEPYPGVQTIPTVVGLSILVQSLGPYVRGQMYSADMPCFYPGLDQMEDAKERARDVAENYDKAGEKVEVLILESRIVYRAWNK